MATSGQTLDQAKLDEFMGRFVGDLGAALSAAPVVIGDRLGLYVGSVFYGASTLVCTPASPRDRDAVQPRARGQAMRRSEAIIGAAASLVTSGEGLTVRRGRAVLRPER